MNPACAESYGEASRAIGLRLNPSTGSGQVPSTDSSREQRRIRGGGRYAVYVWSSVPACGAVDPEGCTCDACAGKARMGAWAFSLMFHRRYGMRRPPATRSCHVGRNATSFAPSHLSRSPQFGRNTTKLDQAGPRHGEWKARDCWSRLKAIPRTGSVTHQSGSAPRLCLGQALRHCSGPFRLLLKA